MMIKAILMDVEGTTTNIRFVHQVLFPYARHHLDKYVRIHHNEKAVQIIVDQVREEIDQLHADLDIVIGALLHWIEQDRKITCLKDLQGLMWSEGYEKGEFTGHVYEDVYKCMQTWKKQGIDMHIYSSGSVKAQKLLFRYSDYGDLTPLLSGYHDTTTGPKREMKSYRDIASAIGFPGKEILFLSDTVEELDAAKQAGMATMRLVRDPCMAADVSDNHSAVTSFHEIKFCS